MVEDGPELPVHVGREEPEALPGAQQAEIAELPLKPRLLDQLANGCLPGSFAGLEVSGWRRPLPGVRALAEQDPTSRARQEHARGPLYARLFHRISVITIEKASASMTALPSPDTQTRARIRSPGGTTMMASATGAFVAAVTAVWGSTTMRVP